MFSLLVLLLSGVLLTKSVLAGFQHYQLDANSLGVSCFPILSELEATSIGGIKVLLEELILNDGQESTDLKIPVLLLPYEDILNFTTIPSWEEYDRGYASNYSSTNLNWDNYFLRNSVDFEENKFILDLYDGYNEIDERRIYNGYLDASKKNGHDEAILPAYKIGMYCAYVAPPINRGIKMMTIRIVPEPSSFYSTNMSYAEYCQTKYIIVTGVLLLVYLVHNSLRFTKGRQTKNMPIISKLVIFYVLIPLLSFMSLEWFVVFIELHSNLSSRKIHFFEYFRLMNEWIQPNWKIFLQFYTLLFTMGYGVIYYNRGASRTFSKIPKRTKNIALSLFIVDLILNNITNIARYLKSYPSLLHQDTIETIGASCFLGSLVFPYVLRFVSFIYYFKTRNIIKKLPPTSTTTEGIDANTRIMKAFKQSSLVIFISPIVSALAWFCSFARILGNFIYSMMNSFPSELKLIENISREQLIMLVEMMTEIMQFTRDNMMSPVREWSGAIKIYLNIGLLYVIWIRNNNALVVEDEKEDLKE
ncbi:uncharacterized protein AC631_04029 [Debaryomyces fabryi]|uniref:Uncharacterized protein n=1 Tax=Debaryomyces fabryi TaxID=58627 RepID=A0A0V1PVA4_9ASCO|nr:uncharacterized protein AC631_04029 [Debaryomyces fabryi]KSA00189.1 hypothetical protein AC631_04029 [Debaryomyces fabryi]CUM48541.1 unnamed protein product [Debaryomyces fabryi]